MADMAQLLGSWLVESRFRRGAAEPLADVDPIPAGTKDLSRLSRGDLRDMFSLIARGRKFFVTGLALDLGCP